MALEKNIPYGGRVGTYIQIGYHHWDRVAAEASAHFHLYETQAVAHELPHQPLRGRMATLRLEGAKFQQYLSTEALAARPAADPVRAALSAAAKVEHRCVISDWGCDVFADAADV